MYQKTNNLRDILWFILHIHFFNLSSLYEKDLDTLQFYFN